MGASIRLKVACNVCPCASPFAAGGDSVRFEVSASNGCTPLFEVGPATSDAEVVNCPHLGQSVSNYDINGGTLAPDSLGDAVFGTVQGRSPTCQGPADPPSRAKSPSGEAPV